MRSVEDNTHGASRSNADDWDSQHPSEDDPPKMLPVERLDVTIAKGNTKGTTSYAHSGGDGDGVLGGEEDCDSRAQLHTVSTRWRVESQAVTQGCHDLVPIRSKTKNKEKGSRDEDPYGCCAILPGRYALIPYFKDSREWANGISN